MTASPATIPVLISAHEAAKALRVSHHKIYRLAHTQEIVGHDIDGVIRIDQQSVIDYLERQRIRRPGAA